MDGTTIDYDGSDLAEGNSVIAPIFVNVAAYYYKQSGLGIGIAREIDLEMKGPGGEAL